MQIRFLTIVFAIAIVNLRAQDSLKTSPKPLRPNEIGVSVLTPIILIAGASEYQERFTNLTYRHRLTMNHAIRALIGAAPQIQADRQREKISSAPGTTLYTEQETFTPSNFQLGLGYEYMWGKRIKPVVGAELIYNNKFQKEEHYIVKQSVENLPGGTFTREERLDSASFVRSTNIDKFGINLFFSVRYEISARWCATATTLVSFRYWQQGRGQFASSNSELNMIGLLGDISLFYKF